MIIKATIFLVIIIFETILYRMYDRNKIKNHEKMEIFVHNWHKKKLSRWNFSGVNINSVEDAQSFLRQRTIFCILFIDIVLAYVFFFSG